MTDPPTGMQVDFVHDGFRCFVHTSTSRELGIHTLCFAIAIPVSLAILGLMVVNPSFGFPIAFAAAAYAWMLYSINDADFLGRRSVSFACANATFSVVEEGAANTKLPLQNITGTGAYAGILLIETADGTLRLPSRGRLAESQASWLAEAVENLLPQPETDAEVAGRAQRKRAMHTLLQRGETDD